MANRAVKNKASAPERVPFSLSFVVYNRPVPKARPRLGNGVVFTPQPTKNFEALIRLNCKKAMQRAGLECIQEKIPLRLSLIFQYGNRKPGLRPTKPDIDNLVKSAMDGLNGTLFRDDALVCQLTSEKRYGPQDAIFIEAGYA